MPHRYTSFLIRHWQLAEGELRITIEHIQTGAAVTVVSLEAATSWLGEQATHGDPGDLTLPGTDLLVQLVGEPLRAPAP